MYELGWKEEIKRYCEQIVLLALRSEADGPGLSLKKARRCLRPIRSEGHEHVIWFLGREGAENDDGWRELVIPFIRRAWPNERRYRTDGTSKTWLALVSDTGDAFPDVLDAVRSHLGNVDWRHAMLPAAIESVAQKFPQETLALLDRVVSRADEEEGPYDLSRVLELLVEAKPTLIGDRRYIRLHRLAARQ